VIACLTEFIVEQENPREKYGFLATFLRDQGSRRADECPFARLLRELDRRFALVSRQEQKQLYLAQAKKAELSPTMLIYELGRGKWHFLERAGGSADEGLFDEVRAAISEHVCDLPEGELQALLRKINVGIDNDLNPRGPSSDVKRDLETLLEVYVYDKFERSNWGSNAWGNHWAQVAKNPPARQGAARSDGTGRGTFVANGGDALIEYTAGPNPSPKASGSTIEWIGVAGASGGRKPPAIDRPRAFDAAFVEREGVVGQPAPNTVSRYGPSQPPRKFLKQLAKIAAALGAHHLVKLMPPPGTDVITSHACIGCFDKPWGDFPISPIFADHHDLRAEHPELVKGWATGIRYYPECVDLFEHAVGAAPPTRSLYVDKPIEREARQ
jgi:hypothetical protein